MFKDYTADTLQEVIRQYWNKKYDKVRLGMMNAHLAVNHCFGYISGVRSVLSKGAEARVFTPEFEKEWSDMRDKMISYMED